jgi:hypothetical protein
MDFFMRKRFLLGAITLLVLLNIVLMYMVWRGRPGSPGLTGAGKEMERDSARIERLLKDELGFDRAQIDKYLALRRSHQQRMNELNNEMRCLKEQMFDGVLKNEPKPKLSDSLLALTQETQNRIERLTFQHLIELKSICTPPQREKLKLLIRELFRPKRRGGEEPSSASRDTLLSRP